MNNLLALKAKLDSFSDTEFVVGFYIRNTNIAQHEWMNPFAEVLKRHGFRTIGINTPQSLQRCPLSSCDITAVVEDENIHELGRINVFIISDMDYATIYPEESKVLGCKHAFDALKWSDFRHQLALLPHLDGWLCPFPLSDATRKSAMALYEGFHSSEACVRKSGYFHIIPAGYPRLTTLGQEIEKCWRKPDSILYAPIGISSLKSHGVEFSRKMQSRLIRALLCNFTSNLIYRPYAEDLESTAVKEIRAEFADEERFIFDDSSGRAYAFSRSFLLITDLSHIAQSFSIATKRPSIYFHPWFGKRAKNEIVRIGIGFETASISGLVRCARNILGNEELRKSISDDILRMPVAPFENSFEEIASWLKDFYDEKALPEWLSIPRHTPTIPEIALISKIRNYDVSVFTSATRFRRPYSTLLCALTLHIGLQNSPNARPWRQIMDIASELLKKPCIWEAYKDISVEDLTRLYSMALIKYMKIGGGADEISLIEGLMADARNLINV